MNKLFQTIRRWYNIHIRRVGGITRVRTPEATSTTMTWDAGKPEPDIRLVRN